MTCAQETLNSWNGFRKAFLKAPLWGRRGRVEGVTGHVISSCIILCLVDGEVTVAPRHSKSRQLVCLLL